MTLSTFPLLNKEGVRGRTVYVLHLTHLALHAEARENRRQANQGIDDALQHWDATQDSVNQVPVKETDQTPVDGSN